MSLSSHFFKLVRLLRQENRRHLRELEADRVDFKRRQKEMELSLEMARRKRLLEMEFELERIKRQQQTDLEQLESKLDQDLRDYQRYLKAVDDLQDQIRQSFTHAPDVIVLTIHHHAKQLLDQMWSTDDLHERLQREREFVKFLTTVYEDTLQSQPGDSQPLLPRRALKLILNNP
ncbi:MAG: hypothetical protein AXA67_08865 [Methylothermaceae bacteria B42]|nr:MAG: hypothetical protein AXA67_08865 [Methylothermaceae bacteria B42]HHJ39414.1 hypothetical protein [Methylothermaceae bacterium]